MESLNHYSENSARDCYGWPWLTREEREFLTERNFFITLSLVGHEIVARGYYGRWRTARFVLDRVLAPWGGDPVYQKTSHPTCDHKNHKKCRRHCEAPLE